VKDRRFRACFLFLALLLPVLVAAQGQRPPAPVPPGASTPYAAPPARSSVTLDGREIAVPVTINQSGPVFGLSPIAEALGGKMTSDESGESITLRIADKDVVIGPGNAIITVGDSIVSLSQPPSRGEGGLQVPVDFLRKTFGDLLGYAFEWHPEISRLTIARRGSRELGVTLDVVHLQGMTTVVLQFPEEPHYQIDRSQPGAQPGTIMVQMLSDRLTPPPAKEVQDPLVQAVVIEPQQVRIQLAAGAQAENYVLENPFRLVFDIHSTSSVEVPAQPLERTRRAPGIHTIVIDPGHGGAESGAVGPGGVMEKNLTLEFARELAGKLGRLGVQTLLTRNDDTTVPHDARPALANQNKADLFISIHLNSSLGAGAHGTETYFLSPQATDARAARAAAAENATPPAAGSTATAPGAGAAAEQEDVDLILWDLAQSHHLSESQRLANLIQGEFNTALQLKDRGVKQAPFRVLKGATMPAVLVELGFISNPEEEKKLQDPAYRDQLLDSLVTAIARYRSSIEGQAAPAPAATPPGAPVPGTSAPAPAPPATKPPARPAVPGRPS
jgi:N-acetylmuramoyl-L-alanine amidase